VRPVQLVTAGVSWCAGSNAASIRGNEADIGGGEMTISTAIQTIFKGRISSLFQIGGYPPIQIQEHGPYMRPDLHFPKLVFCPCPGKKLPHWIREPETTPSATCSSEAGIIEYSYSNFFENDTAMQIELYSQE
jgi:hypothetical protein